MWISASASGAAATSASASARRARRRVEAGRRRRLVHGGHLSEGIARSSTRRPPLSSGVSRGWAPACSVYPRAIECADEGPRHVRPQLLVRDRLGSRGARRRRSSRRTVLDEAILLFRTAAGEIVGLRDRCCHRLAPLSKGRKEGDCVRCGYHGLLFDATGRCIEIPGADTRAREGARAALSGRAEEQVGVRLDGRPGAGRHRRCCPTTSRATRPTGTTCPGYLHYDTPQQLVCDNLLDFSHL